MDSNRAKGFKGRGRGLGALCLLFFAAILVYGCGAAKEAAPPDADKAYYLALDRWSKGFKIYDGFDSTLYVNATYKSEEFRRAYIAKYSADYALGPERSQALLDREIEQHQAYNEFFFTAFTLEEGLNDFEKKDSVWQVYLDDGQGNRVRPISISRIENSESVIREYFPYYDLWSKAYVARFPKYTENGQDIPGATGAMKLVVTGAMGRGELAWQFQK